LGLLCAVQADVELPSGADQRVHVYFTEGSCMTITPVAAPETVTVSGSSVKAASGSQQTQVSTGCHHDDQCMMTA